MERTYFCYTPNDNKKKMKTDVCFLLALAFIAGFIIYFKMIDDDFWFLLTLISVTFAIIYVCYRCNSRNRGLGASNDGNRGADPPGRRPAHSEEDESCNKKGDKKNMTAEDKRRALVRGRLEFRKITKPLIHNKSEESTEVDSETTRDDSENGHGQSETNDNNVLQQLMEMGFGANASRKALYAVGGSDTEAAMDWILEHKDNFILDHKQALSSPPHGNDSKSNENNCERGEAQTKISKAALEKLTKMGLRVNACKKALSAVGGSDTVAAMHWIFEHVTDPDFDDPFPEPDEADSCPFFSVDSMHNTSGTTSSSNKEAACCAICLEPYAAGETVARLKQKSKMSTSQNTCNHWYHEDCILGWLQNHDKCPMCRVDMINDTTS